MLGSSAALCSLTIIVTNSVIAQNGNMLVELFVTSVVVCTDKDIVPNPSHAYSCMAAESDTP